MIQLVRLGDIASGVSVPMGRLAEVYGKVASGGNMTARELRQFTMAGVPMVHELGKEMGVADSAVKKMVESGAVGFPILEKVIHNMTDKGGMFFNLMEKQSHTLTGELTTLRDAFDMMLNHMGASNDGLLSGAIVGATDLLKNYKQILSVITTLVVTYGAYKAATLAVIAVESISTQIKLESALAGEALTTSQGLAAISAKVLSAAQLALNKTMLANPYVLAATVLTALGVAMYEYFYATTAAERATESFNKLKEEQTSIEEKNINKATELIDTATNVSLADYKRVEALEALKQKYPQIFEQYDIEKLKLSDLLDIKKKISNIENTNSTNTYQNEINNTKAEISALNSQLGNADKTSALEVMSISRKLATDNEHLKQLDKKVQDDRFTSYIANLDKHSNAEIQAEIDSRKRLSSRLNKDQFGQVESKNLGGIWNKENLDSQTQQLQSALDKRKEINLNYNQQVAVDTKKIRDEESKLTKLRNSPVKNDVEAQTKRDEEIKAQETKVSEAKSALARLTTQTGKIDTSKVVPFGSLEYWTQILKLLKESITSYDSLTGKSIGSTSFNKKGSPTNKGVDNTNDIAKAQQMVNDLTLRSFDKQIEYQKGQYTEYYEFVLTAGKDAADKQYANLLKGGENYTSYLEGLQKNYSDIVSKGGATKQQVDNLNLINKALNEIRGIKNPFEQFIEELADLKNESQSTYEYLDKLAKKKDDILNGKSNTNLTPEDKTKSLTLIDKNTTDTQKSQLDGLLSKYKDVQQQMKAATELYDNDMGVLKSQLYAANSEKEKKEIQETINARKSAYTSEMAGLGDQVIQSTDLYKKLFGDLTDIGYSSLKKLNDQMKTILSGATKTTGSDGKDSYTITDPTDATKTIQLTADAYNSLVNNIKQNNAQLANMNPFDSLIENIKAYKKAVEDANNVDNNPNSTQDDKDKAHKTVKTASKNVATDVSGSLGDIKQVFDSVTQGLDTMGVKMDDQTKKVLADVEGMLDGATKLAEGIASGNPVSIIQGSIELVSNGIDLVFGAADRRIEESITKDKKAIASLQSAMGALKDAVKNAVGTDWFKAQAAEIDNLGKQLKAQEDELEKEKSKSKGGLSPKYDQATVDVNQATVDASKQALLEANKEIEDKIMTTTAPNLAKSLGDAIWDAVSNGSDAFDVIDQKSKECVRDIMKNWLETIALATPLENELNTYYNKITTKGADGSTSLIDMNSPEFAAATTEYLSQSTSTEKTYAKLVEYLQTNYPQFFATTSSSTTGAISSVSEETAGVLSGQITGVRLSQDRMESIANNGLNVSREQLLSLHNIDAKYFKYGCNAYKD